MNRWFPAGPPIDEVQQIGRGPFLDALEDRLEDAEKRKIFEGRRSGKTSAARAVLLRFSQRSRPAAAVDLARVRDPLEASVRIAEQLAPALEALGVVVASSERHALDELTQPDGPLEYVGQRLPLPMIAREDWKAELPGRFRAVGAPIEPEGLAFLLDQSRCHPYCTMWLGRESARLGSVLGRVDDATVRAALHVVERDELWELRHADD